MKRVFFDIILFVSIFIFPWWVGAVLMVAGIFIFKNFYEYIISCVIVYVLYSVPSDRVIASSIFIALFVPVSFLALSVIKENIIFYKK